MEYIRSKFQVMRDNDANCFIIFICFVCIMISSFATTETIDREYQVYLPYYESDVLVWESQDGSVDTIHVCELLKETSISENGIFFNVFREMNVQYCAPIHEKCSSGSKVIFTYLYLNDSSQTGISVNLLLSGKREYRFHSEFLIEDSLKYMSETPDQFKSAVTLHNRSINTAPKDIRRLFWNLQEGIVGMEDFSGFLSQYASFELFVIKTLQVIF